MSRFKISVFGGVTFFVLLFTISFTTVFAQNEKIQYCSYTSFPGIGRVCNLCNLGQALQALLYIVLFISVIGAFVYAGYLYLTSAANASAQNKAKEVMTGAVVGLALGLSSYLILQAINPDLLSGSCSLESTGTPSDPGTPGEPPSAGPVPPVEPPSAGPVPPVEPVDCEVSSSDNPAQCLLEHAEAGNVRLLNNTRSIIKTAANGDPVPVEVTGGTTNLSKTMLNAMVRIIQEDNEISSFSVTYLTGGSHSSDSLHYDGRAIDIGHVNGTLVRGYNEDAVRPLREACADLGASGHFGPSRPVPDTNPDNHNNHIHCAW